jgi:hypothetical protein
LSQAYSGVNANVLSATVDVDIQSYTLDYDAKTFDSTTTADGGWEDETSATQKITFSFDFFWNPTKSPNGVLGLKPGSTPALQFYVNKPANIQFTGNGQIKKWSVKSKVEDGVLMTASGVNKGVWTVPA